MSNLHFEKTPEKVTREMAMQNTLLFLPENEEQATYVQKRLFALGFSWENGAMEFLRAKDGRTVRSLKECTESGIVLYHQRIYCLGRGDSAKGYKLCDIRQLATDYVPPQDASAPQLPDRLMQMFSEVTARLSAIEDRLSKIEERLAPADAPPALQKSALRAPEPKK